MQIRNVMLGVAAGMALSCAASKPILPATEFQAESQPLIAETPQTTAAAAQAAQPQPPPPAQTFDPKTYAAAFPRAIECEQGARALQAQSADRAWAVLRICVDRGEFTHLKRLIDGAWDKDLQTRQDASILLSKVIAARGGDTESDLAMLRDRRVPLFPLGAAMSQPDTYKGRMIVFRGKVTQLKNQGGKPVVMLAETDLGSQTRDVEVGPAYKSSYSSSGSARVDVKTSRYGSGSLRASGSHESSGRSVFTEQFHENVSSETGREALGRLLKPDPFLEPEKEFVILARFDGVRITAEAETDEDEAQKLAVLSIVGYYAPSALVLE